ncbi:hypothetical protein FEE95_13510 [Maribacter algarum]|uniref:Uncharacterized protein n=1 Tax=Maribacter algarum (ex Zhang et al. 2020) TaxID=2578118 RepID=A0A5S3PS37_9FLAO|nr:hypothetical protein [Maribacter algarum]TMM57494.1 hypothetical protein FEE95_13510 [Maribacter algarum]
MSSAGTIAAAITSLKENRALLKKRKLKDLKTLLYETSGKTELEFKQVSAEELFRIKMEIRTKAKRAAKVEIGIYIGCTIVTLSFFYWLLYL